MEITESINWILSICGGISIIGGAVVMIYKLYKYYRKPSDDNSQKIAEHDVAIKEVQKKLEHDYEDIKEIKDAISILCQGMIALIDNRITNNNVDNLKKTKELMIKYLADKK